MNSSTQNPVESTVRDEIKTGRRFAFGENWARFLRDLTPQKVASAQAALASFFGRATFSGATFLDVGSGSGLHSLVAARMGAIVLSLDYDPQSVACTDELRYHHFPGSRAWTVQQGSALDTAYMRGLGRFDIVYSWGVLHHTGNMWLGIENTLGCVKPGGLLMLAIYNDQGWKSRAWWLVKAAYNRTPQWVSNPASYAAYGVAFGAFAMKYALTLDRARLKRLFSPLERGMSRRHDLIDWMGGFPFDVATVAVLRDYMAARGFVLEKTKATSGLGCNELLFRSTL